jgi:hypothetical protein
VPLIDSIREAVGAEAAAILVRLFGGRKLYVPITASERHAITHAIGIVASVAFSRRFGGEYIDVPNLQPQGPRRGQSALVRQILELAAKQVPEIKIAHQVKCSRQYVGQVLRGDV